MTAIIFDLDGTLLNTLEDLANAANHTMRTLGFGTHNIESYKYRVGNGIPMLLERSMQPTSVDANLLDSALHIFGEYYSAHKVDCTVPYSGIIDMLFALKNLGIMLCVVTNKDNDFANELVRNFFPDTFNIVLGRKNGVSPKPNPDMVFEIMDKLNLSPSQTLYVGDSDVDMFTAQNAGIKSCGVLWGFREQKELLNSGANFIISQPEELIKIIVGGLL